MIIITRSISSPIKYIVMKLYQEGYNLIHWCRTCYFCRKCFINLGINKCRPNWKLSHWLFVAAVLLMCIIFYNITNNIKPRVLKINLRQNDLPKTTTSSYKYVLINDTEIIMEHDIINNSYTSYKWFESKKRYFKDLGKNETPKYPIGTHKCKIDMSSLGPITVKKTSLKIEWVEKEHSHVKLGGFYAPEDCLPTYRVAILVPYRSFKENLTILLYYIHRLLKIHRLQYRIFIIEQFGKDKFNRGMLFNIAYLESQRFGAWDCLIFHDVDAIPEDDRISYTCSQSPLHLASAVEQFGYNLRYEEQFGCVTALTPAQYKAVNGYSNFYWSWGGEDDDMSARLKFTNLQISRYPVSIGRFATLSHPKAESGRANTLFLLLCRHRFQIEGLKTTNYKLISVDKRKLFTHILVDVNPQKLKLDEKNLIHQMLNISGRNSLVGCRNTFLMHKITKQTTTFYYIS